MQGVVVDVIIFWYMSIVLPNPTHGCVCVCVCVDAHMHPHTQIHAHTHSHTQIHAHTHSHTHIHTHTAHTHLPHTTYHMYTHFLCPLSTSSPHCSFPHTILFLPHPFFPLQPIQFNGDIEIAQISLHPEGKHILALSQNREVYSWGIGENGQLGLGDIKCVVGSKQELCNIQLLEWNRLHGF